MYKYIYTFLRSCHPTVSTVKELKAVGSLIITIIKNSSNNNLTYKATHSHNFRGTVYTYSSHILQWFDNVSWMTGSGRASGYLSHCYSIAWDRLQDHLCDLCACVCVCLSVLSRSQFWTDFDEIWHSHPEPETKEPFRWGSKSNKGIPYFYPILPQIGTHVMHFQWETWNASLTSSMDRL